MAFLQAAVLIPTVAAAGGAGELDEANPAFDQAAGDEALARVNVRGIVPRVASDSPVMSINSGTALCLRKASS